MKKINENDFESRITNLDNKEDLDSYSKYHELMTVYFMKALGLDNIEKDIDNSGLGFQNVKEDDMDIYQYLSSEHLKYFYIRNNLKLENLSDNEINKLKSINSLDNNTIDFLNNTIVKVIHDNTKEHELYASVVNPKYIESCDKVIIGFRYDEFADTDLSDDDWAVQNERQNDYLDKKLSELQNNINSKNIPVRVFVYDDSLVNVMRDSQKKTNVL